MTSLRLAMFANFDAGSHTSVLLGLGVSSNVFFVLMDTCAQQLQLREVPTGQIVFLRMVSKVAFRGSIWCLSQSTTAILLAVYLSRTDDRLLKELFEPRHKLVWLRSLAAVVSLFSFFAALRWLPLSDAIASFHIRPFPTALLCWAVLGEFISKSQIAASGV